MNKESLTNADSKNLKTIYFSMEVELQTSICCAHTALSFLFSPVLSLTAWDFHSNSENDIFISSKGTFHPEKEVKRKDRKLNIQPTFKIAK